MRKKKAPADITNTKFASPTDVALAQAQKYRICSDESGHDYYIKVQDVDAFYNWVAFTEDEDIEYHGPCFDENRIDGHFTFADPRCD